MPSVLNDKLPAPGGHTSSEVVANHLNAKHGARKAVIECEASEKIRRTLRHNVRHSTTLEFTPGDKVYYKRLNSDYWKGPAEVIGKDDHQVTVKHGGSLIRVHPISLRLVEEQVTCRDMASETERIVNGEEDNADDQRDENMDTSIVEEASVENANVTEALNNENAQQYMDVMEEMRSLDTYTPRNKRFSN